MPDNENRRILFHNSGARSQSTAARRRCLPAGIQKSFVDKRARRARSTAYSKQRRDLAGFAVNPSTFETTAVECFNTPELNEEIFGPTTLLIRSQKHEELLDIARSLEGHLHGVGPRH